MAESRAFTQRGLEKMVAPTRERWLAEPAIGHNAGRLVVRLQPNGIKLFYFRYFIKGKKCLIPIGQFGKGDGEGSGVHTLTLEAARSVAREYSNLYRFPEGHEELAAIRAAKGRFDDSSASSSVPGEAARTTLLELCSAYLDFRTKAGGNLTSVRSDLSMMKCHLANSVWAGRPASALTMEGVTDILREVIGKGKGRTAGKLRALLHAAFATALRARSDASIPKDLLSFKISANPVSGTASLSRFSKPRNRALSEAELGHLWYRLSTSPKAETADYRLVRLGLLLGGQRVAQLHRVLKKDLELDEATILLYDGKGGRDIPREHLLPLTASAQIEAKWWLDVSNSLESPYLFPGTEAGSNMDYGAETRVINEVRQEMLSAGECTEHFHHQDLRRTTTTRMAQLGINTEVRCRIQSHGLAGVENRHYNRFAYLKEKREALGLWERYLIGLADAVAQGKSSSSISDK